MLGTVLLLLALAKTACPSPASVASRRAEALKKLLEVFGMEDPPAPPTHFKQPPQYMVDLFNTVANADGVTKNPDILEGNTVRSFLDKSKGWGAPCGAERGRWRCRPWFCSSQRTLLSSSQRGDAVPVCPLQRSQEREDPDGRAAPLPPLAQGHRWAQKASLLPGEDGDGHGDGMGWGWRWTVP